MNAVVVFEWKFSPPDYFEEPVEIAGDDYVLIIADGKAEAKVRSEIYDANPSIRQDLHNALNDRFLGAQLLSFRAYELSDSTMTRLHPDGRRDTFIEPKPVVINILPGIIDFRVTDKEGNVVKDSKRDRIEKRRGLGDKVVRYRSSDATLASLLRSHDAAIRDRNNELVHLYEIREAVLTRFGSKDAALQALGVSAAQWSRMGRLCNDEPLRQGRHRGAAVGSLRDASHIELTEIREISRAIIEGYMRCLEALPARS
jgi:hypothetical protein